MQQKTTKEKLRCPMCGAEFETRRLAPGERARGTTSGSLAIGFGRSADKVR